MLIALFLALWVGLALGLFGGGGSILSVAVLSFALDLPPKTAMSASLLIIGITSTGALLAQRDQSLVSVRTGAVFGGAGMLGAFAGGRLASLIPEAVLLAAFGLLALLTSIAVLRVGAPSRAGDARETQVDKPACRLAAEQAWVACLRVAALALSIGIVSGLLGAGGGFLIVPALARYGGLPWKRAVATSLLVMALQSFAGFVGHLGQPRLDRAIVAPFTLMATLGSVAGRKLAARAAQELLQRGFSALVLLVALAVIAVAGAQP